MTGANAPNASRVRSAHRERTPPRAWSGADSKPMAQQDVVRRHCLCQVPAGLTVPGARDRHMVEADCGLSHRAQHNGRAGRRCSEDVPDQEGQSQRMHTPQRPRHPLLDGLDIFAVGQRCHGVAHGPGQVGGHARTGLCHARRGSAGSVRVYRGYIHRARIHTVLGNLSPAEFE